MSIALFDGDEISSESYCVFNGSSQPDIITFPRTIGGLIQESGIVEKVINLKSYIIMPVGKTRADVEDYFHQLNEKVGAKEASLIVNDNEYLLANGKGIDFDFNPTNRFAKFNAQFHLNNQDTSGVIRQLTCPGLEGFTRGRKSTFVTTMEDGTEKTFTFWHNFDVVKNLEVQIKLADPTRLQTSNIIRTGGFEKIICRGWIVGPEVDARRNLEAYFYNIMNGPLGRIGSLSIDGNLIENAFFSDFSNEDTNRSSSYYECSFLTSLQC